MMESGTVKVNSEMKTFWISMKKMIVFLLMMNVLLFLPQTLVSAKEEDRDYWYSQAKDQMEELIAARKSSIGYAKNVILFVGDGMGLSTVTAGRILKGQKKGQSGEDYRLSWDKFPFVALAKTYNLDAQTGDSSACATALMCGVKANVNTVGLDHRGKFEDCLSSYSSGVTSLIDWAQKHGKSTGIVTNTRLTHGTPSALYAKTPSRYWEDDAKVPKRSQPLCKDIARQLVELDPGKNINVLLGGGRRHWIPITEYDREERDQRGRRTDGRNLIDAWVYDKKSRDLDAEYVWNNAQFNHVDPRYTDYLLGLFGYSHLDFEVDRNKGPDGDPSLAEMTSKAIQILQKNKEHGFFLMVEGGRIDHAHHHNNARRALEEVDALDEAVKTALNLTDTKDTLVVLTADHSHVFTLGGDNTPRGTPLAGLDVEMSDVDGKPYTILLYSNGPGYAHSTPTGRQDLTGFNTQDINFVQQAAVPRKYETHGGEDVPVYAQGPGSHLFTGTVEQTYIPHAIAYAACISDDNSHCQKDPREDMCSIFPVHNDKPPSGHHQTELNSQPGHSNPVIVHLPGSNVESTGSDSLNVYDPYTIHDSLQDKDPYSAHVPISVNEAKSSAHDPSIAHDSDYDSYPSNNPSPVHDPASVYDASGRSNIYSNSNPFSGSRTYAGNNPYAAPNPYPESNPISLYDHFPEANIFPHQDKSHLEGASDPIPEHYPDSNLHYSDTHPYYSDPQSYPVQNPIPIKSPNPVPAVGFPAPSPTSRRAFSYTTPSTTDQRRSNDPWSWNSGMSAFHSWNNYLWWYLLSSVWVFLIL